MSSKWSKGTSGPAGDEVANLVAHAFRADGFDASEDGTGRGTPIVATAYDVMFNDANGRRKDRPNGGCYIRENPGTIAALTRAKPETYPAAGMAVRRLTPRECERLQGFPDDYTLINYNGKSAANGPRYKALGNAMCVNVMRWIGQRILMIEEEL